MGNQCCGKTETTDVPPKKPKSSKGNILKDQNNPEAMHYNDNGRGRGDPNERTGDYHSDNSSELSNQGNQKRKA